MTPEEDQLILYYIINFVTVIGFLLLGAARDGSFDDSEVSRRYTPC
jgi:hypothetical protein